MESELVKATWGLVVATVFLVIAAGIPLVRDATDRRERRRLMGAQLVPDMNILRSRLEGGCDKLKDGRSLSPTDIGFQIQAANGELEMISDLIKAGNRPSLTFVNDTYLVRHLITQARQELQRADRLAGDTDAKTVRGRDDALREARRDYKAALMSLDAAEQLLPSKVRTINGKSFWDRFAQVSDERRAEAERSFVAVDKRA